MQLWVVVVGLQLCVYVEMRPIRVSVCLLILTSLAVSAVVGLQRSEDGRVVLNLGFLTSKSGRFASYGK